MNPCVPKISVVMPVYNGEAYVQDALNSVLAQTCTDFELIVVNDGSTDDTLRIVQSYSDPRIRLLSRQVNRGLAVSRNEGIDAAAGQYIAMLDSDDVAISNRLEVQSNFLDKHQDVGVVGSWVEVIGEDGASYGETWRFETSPYRLPVALLFHNCFAQSSVMMRRDLLGKSPYRQAYPPAEDYDLWTRLAFVTRLANIPKPLVQYRYHSEGTSRKKAALAEESASKVIVTQLESLGLRPEHHEMRIHRHLGRGLGCDDVVSFEMVETWLEKLVLANKDSERYDHDAFGEVIHERWFAFCRASSQLGLKALKKYRQSPMGKQNSLRLKVFCAFALGCVLRK